MLVKAIVQHGEDGYLCGQLPIPEEFWNDSEDVPTGGEERVLDPWNLDEDGTLSPIAYSHDLTSEAYRQ
jgi:hypothetical protein